VGADPGRFEEAIEMDRYSPCVLPEDGKTAEDEMTVDGDAKEI
jgi:hypothetical protein